ncbi:mating type protein [Naviculisporaceae sp. PSN 640]
MSSVLTTNVQSGRSIVRGDSFATVPGQVEQVTTKKKVNGFMGFRTYYSSIFSQFPQRARSPLLTKLWRQDPFHNEWDFMCAVYSAIRVFLDEENISFKDWINCAATHLGIISRDKYMQALGWQLERCEDGTNQLLRTAAVASIQNCIQPMNGLGLFNNCLSAGLRINNARSIIDKLSDPSYDLICMTTHVQTRPRTTANTHRSNRKKGEIASPPVATVFAGMQCLPEFEGTDGSDNSEIQGTFYQDYSQQYEALDPEGFFSIHGSGIDTMLGTIIGNEIIGQTEISGSNDSGFFDMNLPIDCSNLGYENGHLLQDVELGYHHDYARTAGHL